MASTIVTKNSSTASAVPVSGDLTQGELAVNVTDKRLFTKNSGGTVVELGTNPASLALPNGTTNGVAYLNGSKVVTTGSALTFDGTNFLVGIDTSTALSGYTVPGQFKGSLGIISGNNEYAGALLRESSSTNSISLNADPGNLRANSFLGFGVDGSEGMRLTSTGLGIGTSSPVSRLDVRAASAVIGNYQQIQAFSTDTAAINLGGGISLGGYYSGVAGLASFGTIVGRKENGTDGNYAGYLAFGTNAQATGVVERMRLDSSGNLGLGVTPSAWRSGDVVLDIGSVVSLVSAQSANTRLYNNTYVASGGTNTYKTTAAASYYDQGSGIHRWFNAPSGTAGNAITFTQAMTLDASGNLGIGTTSPVGNFNVNTTGNTQVTISAGSTGLSRLVFQGQVSNNRGFIDYDNTSSVRAMIFRTDETERARIDSSGRLLVGQTSYSTTTDGVALQASGSVFARSGTGAATNINIANGNGVVGTITASGTSTAYNTSSDYRLKESIAPMTGALAKVAALKPVTYKWKADGSDGEGFIAHELQAVVPQCVTGEKDAVDAEGNPQYQGIDTSFLVATLTAAIQELKAEFDAYKATHP